MLCSYLHVLVSTVEAGHGVLHAAEDTSLDVQHPRFLVVFRADVLNLAIKPGKPARRKQPHS